ncbi:MAG: AMP phosphorylase [Sulfolobales archaeon]
MCKELRRESRKLINPPGARILAMRIPAREVRVDAGDLRLAFISKKVSSELGVSGGARLRVQAGSSTTSLWAVVTDDNEPSIGIPTSIYSELGRPGEVDVDLFTGTPAIEYIVKKLYGNKLTYDEIRSIIRDIVSGVLSEAEIAAFVVAQTVVGMDVPEIVSLTKAMVETGEVLNFGETAYDIHSIGGVPGNSKVSIVAVPIVAAAGLFIPKTSSRAITSPAGTADTMETIAPVTFTAEEVLELAKKVRGFIIWGGSLNLAPADDILIRVEHKLRVDPVSQMVASILSKKLSMSVKNLVLDIPVGHGAKIESIQEGRKIASLFTQVSRELGIDVRCAITYGDQPVGYSIGPSLEAREALETLLGGGPMSVREKAASLAGLVLEMAGVAPSGEGRAVALKLLDSSKAYETFKRIVEAMGGNPNVKPEDIPVGRYKAEIRAVTDGYVTGVHNKAVAQIAIAAGAPKDKGAGVKLYVKRGHRVKSGQLMMEIFSNSEGRLTEALKLASKLNPIVIEGMVLEVHPDF